MGLRIGLLPLPFLVSLCFPLASWTHGIAADQKGSQTAEPTQFKYVVDPQVKALVEKAQEQLKGGALKDALDSTHQAIELSRQMGSGAQTAELMINLAMVYNFSGNMGEARRLNLEEMNLAVDVGNEELEAAALVQLGNLYQGGGEYQQAEEVLTRAVATARKVSAFRTLANALMSLANVQGQLGKKDDAYKNLDEALRIAELNKYPDQVALIRVSRAGHYGGENRLDEASSELKEAEATLQTMSADNPLLKSMASLMVARLAAAKGDWDKAITLMEGVTGASESSQVRLLGAAAIELLASAFEAKGLYDKAIPQWMHLLALGKEVGAPSFEAEGQLRLGLLYERLDQVSLAITHLEQARGMYRALENHTLHSQALMALARIYEKGNENEKLLVVAEDGLAAAEQLGNMTWKLAALSTKTGTLIKLERYEEAIAEATKGAQVYYGIEKPTDQDKIFARSLNVYRGIASWQANDILNGVIGLAKAVALSRELKDEEAAKQYLEGMAQMMDWEVLLSTADKLYAEKRLVEAAYGYAPASVYFELMAQEEKRRQPLERLSEITIKWSEEPDGVRKLQDLLGGVWGTSTVAEGVVVGSLMAAYLVRGDGKAADDAFDVLMRILPSINYDPEAGRFAGSFCMATFGAGQLGDSARAVFLARSCKTLLAHLDDPGALLAANAGLFSALVANGQLDAAEGVLAEIANVGGDVAQLAAFYVWLAEGYLQVGHATKTRSLLVEAERLLPEIRNEEARAEVYHDLGSLLARLGESPKSAVGYLSKAKELFKRNKRREDEVLVLLSIAELQVQRKELPKGLRTAEEALQIAESIGKSSRVYGEALSRLGDLYSALERNRESFESYQAALFAFRQAKWEYGEFTIHLKLMFKHAVAGNQDKAVAEGLEALAAAEGSGNLVGIRIAAVSLGSLYADWGKYQLALQYYERALEVAQGQNDLLGEASVLHTLAGMYMVVGDSERAASCAERAFELLKQTPNRFELLRSLLTLGSVYGDRTSAVRDPEKARGFLGEAMKLAEAIGTEEAKRRVGLVLVELYIVDGPYERAVEILKAHAAYYEQVNNSFGLANVLLSLSEAYKKAGRLDEAAAAVERATPLVSEERDTYLKGRLYYHTASLLRAQGRYEEAVREYEKATQLIESVRATLSGETRLGMSRAYEFIYDELIDSLYELYKRAPDVDKPGIASKALRVSEQNKARVFTESLAGFYLREGAAGVPLELVRQERQLTTRRQALLRRLGGFSDESTGGDSETLMQELQIVVGELNQLVERLRKEHPSYASFKYPQPVELGDVRLREGELVLAYNTGDQATYLWVLAGNSTGTPIQGFYKIPVDSVQLARTIRSLRQPFVEVAPSYFRPETSEELFRLLLGPVGQGALTESSRVVVIPDGDLYFIPFEVLSSNATKEKYWSDSVPVSYFPSITALALARLGSTRSLPKAALFAMGDPVSDPGDERLPARSGGPEPSHNGASTEGDSSEQIRETLRGLRTSGFSFYRLPATGREVAAIARVFQGSGGDVEVKVGFDATKSALLATDLSRFRFLHLATHGILPQEASAIGEPALVLSMEGTDPQDMFLRMSDVAGMRLNAELVTLSACETGLGKSVRTEGIMGLPRAFMFAGATAVVVSLWKVADDSTAELMQEFYTDMAAGMDKAAALALAKRKLREAGKANPFFWAPFIMWGE